MITLCLKIFSFLIALGGGTIALIGETSKSGKLTRRGYVALALLLVGFFASVALVITAELEKKELEKQARQKEKLELEISEKKTELARLWNIQLEQPLVGIYVRLFLYEGLKSKDFVKFANRIDIEIKSFSQLTNDKASSRHFKWLYTEGELDAEKAIKLAFVSDINDRLSIFPEIGLWKVDASAPSWTSSVDNDWANPKALVGGVLARAPWSVSNFYKSIKTVKDLPQIRWISVRIPKDFDWEKIHEYKIYIYAAGKSLFEINIKELQFLNAEDHTVVPAWIGREATIEGSKLLELWREQFSIFL